TLISLEHHVWYEPQPHEPPSADPHARWCGRGAVMLTAPYADVRPAWPYPYLYNSHQNQTPRTKPRINASYFKLWQVRIEKRNKYI
ncbi:MAG: hypothetical protein ACKVOY_04180, partial [Burkholderiaceae bacterium]